MLAFWPEGNGMEDMEAYGVPPVEELDSKPTERGQEGFLTWDGVAEEYRRSWSRVELLRAEEVIVCVYQGGRAREEAREGMGEEGEIEK